MFLMNPQHYFAINNSNIATNRMLIELRSVFKRIPLEKKIIQLVCFLTVTLTAQRSLNYTHARHLVNASVVFDSSFHIIYRVKRVRSQLTTQSSDT